MLSLTVWSQPLENLKLGINRRMLRLISAGGANETYLRNLMK